MRNDLSCDERSQLLNRWINSAGRGLANAKNDNCKEMRCSCLQTDKKSSFSVWLTVLWRLIMSQLRLPDSLLRSLSILSWAVPSCSRWKRRMKWRWPAASICLASPPQPSPWEFWTSTRVQNLAPTPSPSNWRRVYQLGPSSQPSLPRTRTASWGRLSGKTPTGTVHSVMMASV